jgi:alcohol dehydrogenase
VSVAHGVTLTMVLPQVLEFNAAVRTDRLADIAFALGVGDTGGTAGRNAAESITAVASLADRVGMTHTMADFGIGVRDFDQIAADALDDEVLANTPRSPAAADIRSILLAAQGDQG